MGEEIIHNDGLTKLQRGSSVGEVEGFKSKDEVPEVNR